MESKNIKIVDEHGIDRIANIICSIDVDGSDYVVYWIERDNDNDNLFVSKLLKNNDGTSTMMNIEDSMEKGNLSDIVKELITHCINDEKDNIDVDSVVLKNGKNIKIANVLFNKEQNINVQKTYITTVKKSVTKVSEKYYHIDKVPEVAVENVPLVNEEKEIEVAPVEMPSLGEVAQTVSEPEVVMPAEPVIQNVELESVPVQEEKTPVISIDTSAVKTEDVPPVSASVVPEVAVPIMPEPVIPVESVAQNVESSSTQVQQESNLDAKMNIIGASPVPQVSQPVADISETPVNQIPSMETIAKPVESVVSPTAPVMVAPEVSVPVQEPAPTVNNVPTELFFDGSKETNLAGAFNGEIDDTKPITTAETVTPIREFGQDEPVIPIVNDVTPAVQEQPKTLTKSPGFANNKFFMVIALTFFIASCVFLGYEVYKYFQMR